jgi:hypothetical protein
MQTRRQNPGAMALGPMLDGGWVSNGLHGGPSTDSQRDVAFVVQASCLLLSNRKLG